MQFNIGQTCLVKATGKKVAILEISEGTSQSSYTVFEDQERKTYFEEQLTAVSDNSETKEKDASFLKARLTSYNILSPSLTNLFSLKSGKIQFVPYQYRPVLKLLKSDNMRMLIADEVGVGKTIETGLIIKELQARQQIETILVLCPKPLVTEKKWYHEMKRFDEDFDEIDGKSFRHIINEAHLDGEWPEKYSKCIIPFSLFDSNNILGRSSSKKTIAQKGLLDLNPPPKFDLVIVDEAHNARNSDSITNAAVRFFCDNSEAVIFLTATPIQLGNSDLFVLLNMLRPDLIADEETFNEMSEPNQYINETITICRNNDSNWQKRASEELDKISSTNWGRRFLWGSPSFQSVKNILGGIKISDKDRINLITTLETLYTFYSLINRTRRRDIENEFLCIRAPKTVAVEFTPNQKELYDRILRIVEKTYRSTSSNVNPKFLMTMIQRQASSCLFGLRPFISDRFDQTLLELDLAAEFEGLDIDSGDLFNEMQNEMDEIRGFMDQLEQRDPKLDELKKILFEKNNQKKNKVLLFSFFIHTLNYLYNNLKETGLRIGLIHGNVKDEERRAQKSKFALPKENKEAYDVLLSSEIGCEGLDFQFCDMLINYDIPWNPMKIEQRIGRIDRYGQESEKIAIVNFVTPGTIDYEIYNRCLLRIGIFNRSIGSSEEILGAITENISSISSDFSLSDEDKLDKLQQLSDNKLRAINELEALENEQGELHGLSLPSKDWEQELKNAQSLWLSPRLIRHTLNYFLREHLEQENEPLTGSSDIYSLRLSREAKLKIREKFSKLSKKNNPALLNFFRWLEGDEQTMKIAFSAEKLSPEENVTFINVLHPLLREAANYFKNAPSFIVHLKVKDVDVPKGRHPFALFSWNKMGSSTDWVITSIAADSKIRENLLDLLAISSDEENSEDLKVNEEKMLTDLHYTIWETQKKVFVEKSKALINFKLQSMKSSFETRSNRLKSLIANANDEKIKRMRIGELERGRINFERKQMDFDSQIQKVDIIHSIIARGTITVR